MSKSAVPLRPTLIRPAMSERAWNWTELVYEPRKLAMRSLKCLRFIVQRVVVTLGGADATRTAEPVTTRVALTLSAFRVLLNTGFGPVPKTSTVTVAPAGAPSEMVLATSTMNVCRPGRPGEVPSALGPRPAVQNPGMHGAVPDGATQLWSCRTSCADGWV